MEIPILIVFTTKAAPKAEINDVSNQSNLSLRIK